MVRTLFASGTRSSRASGSVNEEWNALQQPVRAAHGGHARARARAGARWQCLSRAPHREAGRSSVGVGTAPPSARGDGRRHAAGLCGAPRRRGGGGGVHRADPPHIVRGSLRAQVDRASERARVLPVLPLVLPRPPGTRAAPQREQVVLPKLFRDGLPEAVVHPEPVQDGGDGAAACLVCL